MLAEINKNTTTFIRELNGKMNRTVSWLLGIVYLQVFSLNLRTRTVRISYINFLSGAGWRKTAQVKVVSRQKRSVLVKPPPFPFLYFKLGTTVVFKQGICVPHAVYFSGRISDIRLKWKTGMSEKVDEKRLIRNLSYVTEEEALKECGCRF